VAELAPETLDLTDDQREIQALAREFARTEIRPVSADVDERDTYTPLDLVYKAAEVGLTSYMLPEHVGGGGIGDVLTGCIVQEELNWGCAGIGNLITSGAFFGRPVIEVGTPNQQQRWLAPLCGPQPPLTSLASTEPGVGSDTAAMATTAVRSGEEYVLNGQKTWISNGGIAEYYVIFATVAPGTGSKGVTAFVVEKSDPGITFGEPMRKMGQRAIINTEVFLQDCTIPADRLLGEEGKGFYSLMHTFDESRIHLAASAIGIARAAFEYSVEYAKTRNAFGRPIGQHHPHRRRPPALPPRRPPDGRRQARPGRGGNGQAVRVRDRHLGDVGGHPDARRLGLLPRVPRREVVARRPAGGARGGHLRHPAPDRQPPTAARLTKMVERYLSRAWLLRSV
jgi:alkylation response protein AidB-like acyl-CoA dehydrogenase